MHRINILTNKNTSSIKGERFQQKGHNSNNEVCIAHPSHLRFALLPIGSRRQDCHQGNNLVSVADCKPVGEFVKAIELWERDGIWPFHGMVDDHLKANVTFHKLEEKERTYEFTIEGEDDGDGDLIDTDYELYVRVLNHCAFNGKAEWKDFDVRGLGRRNRWSADKTLYAENQVYDLRRYPYKRSVSGHDDNQH
ncbi:hypothetical protein B9Z55_003091 [Caenorhabditis nigoni]|uniref:Uncharacterized protein n=1 Tax=Caenorhabditis nigoni TaxID=1611254 RepID=A0A2G5VNF5_9PELO|nr:hypothetical protein B9Z55_003091 [Caenorhabditis nigoni]